MATHSRAPWVSFARLGCLRCCRARGTSAEQANHGPLTWSHCPRCALEVGTGTTFFASHWSGGITVPVFVQIDGSRAHQTQTGRLDATSWNFAHLLALRYSPGRHVFLEFSARHWSNAWIELPDRGQSLVMLGVGLR